MLIITLPRVIFQLKIIKIKFKNLKFKILKKIWEWLAKGVVVPPPKPIKGWFGHPQGPKWG